MNAYNVGLFTSRFLKTIKLKLKRQSSKLMILTFTLLFYSNPDLLAFKCCCLPLSSSQYSSILAVGKASAAVQGDTSLTYQLPDLSLIPDISSLVGHLAKLYPLIWESSSNDSPLQPTLQTYMSWPVG